MSMYLRFDPGLRGPISDDELIDEILSEHPEAREELERIDDFESDDSELYDALFEASDLDEVVLLSDAA